MKRVEKVNKKAISKANIIVIAIIIILILVAIYFYFDDGKVGLSPPAQCKDTIDNDGDKNIDYPKDSGCKDKDDDSEASCVAGSTNCGVGACRRSSTCFQDKVSCTPGTPSTEICTDSIDNDCDGVVNDGCATLGRILRVTRIYNLTGISISRVSLVDVRTGDNIDAIIIRDGEGTIGIGGRVYTIRYQGFSSDENNWMEIEDIAGYPPEARTGIQRAFRNSYLIMGNPAWNGFIARVAVINNGSVGFSDDDVELVDFRTGNVYPAVITREGEGTITIQGKVHTIRYFGSSTIPAEDRYIEIDFEQRVFRNSFVVFPE